MNKDIFLAELNSTLPDGFRALEAYYPESNKSLMSLVKEAIYEIKINDDINFNLINELFSKDEILIEKESKDNKKIMRNIKENIIDFKIENNICTFHVTAGSNNNLNPNSIIMAICKYIKNIEDFDINRKKLILS